MLSIVGVRQATDAASMIERAARESRQHKSFIAIQTTTEPLEVRVIKFVGKVVIGETREGQIVIIPLGEVTLRDAHRPTIIINNKDE